MHALDPRFSRQPEMVVGAFESTPEEAAPPDGNAAGASVADQTAINDSTSHPSRRLLSVPKGQSSLGAGLRRASISLSALTMDIAQAPCQPAAGHAPEH